MLIVFRKISLSIFCRSVRYSEHARWRKLQKSLRKSEKERNRKKKAYGSTQDPISTEGTKVKRKNGKRRDRRTKNGSMDAQAGSLRFKQSEKRVKGHKKEEDEHRRNSDSNEDVKATVRISRLVSLCLCLIVLVGFGKGEEMCKFVWQRNQFSGH